MAEKRQTGAYQTVIKKQEKAQDKKLISIRSMDGERIAYKNLGLPALQIYLYMTRNRNGYPCLIWSNDIIEEMGFSRPTYTRAIKELKEKGFLVKRDDDSEKWEFHDTPVFPIKNNSEKKEPVKSYTIEKEIVLTKKETYTVKEVPDGDFVF